MFEFRSLGSGRSVLGLLAATVLAVGAAACGADSSTTALPAKDAGLGARDSSLGSRPDDACDNDATVVDDAASDDAGDDGATDAAGDDGSSDASSPASDAGEGGTSPVGDGGVDGGGEEAGIADAGAHDASAPDAGTADAGSVGTIPCGNSTCTAASQVCCYGATAQPDVHGHGACNGTPLDCRSTANCHAGDICCLSGAGANAKATCEVGASCGGGVQLCANGDCAANETCFQGLCVRAGTGGFDGGLPGFDGGFRGFDGGFLVP